MCEGKILSACLIDGDAAAKQSRRTSRQRAIAVATAIEFVLFIGLLLWPVLTPGSPPGEVVILPRFPVPFIKRPRVHAEPRSIRAQESEVFSNPVFAPPRVPPRLWPTNPSPPKNAAPPVIGFGSESFPQGWRGNGERLEPGNWTISPPAQREPRMIHATEGVQAGMLIHRVEPLYPPIALIARISGTVELRAIIARDGAVRSVEVLSGNPLLARAAGNAVWQWRYRPTILDGEAVEVETRITVRFVLGD
jgi:protein TonB